MLNNTAPCYDHAFNSWNPFTKEPNKRSPQQCICAVNPSLCARDVSDSHQPHECHFFSGERGDAVFSVAPSWRVSIPEDLSVQCVTEALHGSFCFIKANLPPSCALCLSTCPFSTRPRAPFRAERDACVWASVSPFPPFEKTERGEESTDPHSSICHSQEICPFIHQCERTHCHIHTAFVVTIRQQVRLFVSQAARPSRHSVICTVLQIKSTTASSVSSLQNHSCINNNTGSLDF